MSEESRQREERVEQRELIIRANYEVFVLGIVIFSIFNSVLRLAPLSEEQDQIIALYDLGLSIFLMIDALYRLMRAVNKWNFLFRFYGWLILLGSLPIPFIRIFRLLAYWLVIGKLRRGDYGQMGRVVVQRRAQTTLLATIFAAIVVFELGSLLILTAEQYAPAANITTAGDAIWWGLVTISTVGYGDTFPITKFGRAIGVILIITGVGLFTTTTSFLARWFMRPRNKLDKVVEDSSEVAPALTVQIQEIRSILKDLDDSNRETMDTLSKRLDALERNPLLNSIDRLPVRRGDVRENRE